MIVAITQGKTLFILLGIGTQLTQLGQPMHAQCGLIGPQNGPVDFSQDHPFGQSRDDLL
ncbi:hypothetical protein D3C80_1133010 [compost metagenome]